MLTAKAIVTTTPEVVRWLSLLRQTSFPASSVWQITPGAHVAVGVIVGVQVIVFPLLTEQTLVVTMFVTEHTKLDVVLPVVSLAAVTDAFEALVVEDAVDESLLEVAAAVVAAAEVVVASAVEGAVVDAAALVVLASVDFAVVFSLSVLVSWSLAVSSAVVFPPFFVAEVVSSSSALLFSSP